MATALFAALATTSITSQATDSNWYFGNFGQDLTSTMTFGGVESGWTKANTGVAGLTFTAGDTTAAFTQSVSLKGLGLTYSAEALPNANNYLNLDTEATGVTVVTLKGTDSGDTTLTAKGFTVTGSLDLSQTQGQTTTTAASVLTALETVTVLQVSANTNNLTVNSGGADVQFTVKGAALNGLVIDESQTWNGTAYESYILTSDKDATAVSIAGTGSWTKGFSATANSNGATGNNGNAIAVDVDTTGTGTWSGGAFSATAAATGLSPNATALNVGAVASGTPIDIGGGLITIGSRVTTAAPGTPTLTNGYSSIGINYTATSTDGGTISGDGEKTDYAVSITSVLNISNAGDLVQSSSTATATGASAVGVLMDGDAGKLSITAGALAEGNLISATVNQNGAALTQVGEDGVNAYAVHGQAGELTIGIAPETLKAGQTSSAVLNITATNNATTNLGAEADPVNVTAAAIYAQGENSDTTITVDASSGKVNISAIAGGGVGSNAYGVWAQGGTNNQAVELTGNAVTVSASGGEENNVFTTTAGDLWAFSADDDFGINNAAIFADEGDTPTNVGTITSSAETLTVTGDVVALSNKSTSGEAGIIITGYDSATQEDSVNTSSTINGNLYALKGGMIDIGASAGDNPAKDAVTVTGNTYVVGAIDEASGTVSTLSVYTNATYTAQGDTIVANGGSLAVNGGTYIAQGDVIVSNATPLETNTDAVATIAVGDESSVGGTFTANGSTSVTAGGQINITGQEGSPAIYNALGDFTVAKAATISNGVLSVDEETTVTIGAEGTLNIGSATVTGVTATVNQNGVITGDGNLVVFSGSTLVLNAETPESDDLTVDGTAASKLEVNSNIYGTLQIVGTGDFGTAEEPAINYFNGGLGTMNIEDGGTIIGDDNGLYLGLKEGDNLTFNQGSTMDADVVNVGVESASSATLQIAGGAVSTDQLIVGEDGTGEVELSAGTLTLADPTTPEGAEYPQSNLTIGSSGTFNLGPDGTLVTNSQNLWKQAASEDIEEGGLEGNIGGSGTITGQGGLIELTDSQVEASWLVEAQNAATNGAITGTYSLLIDGQLLNEGKAVPSILPTVPDGAKEGTLGYDDLMPSGGILASTALNATTQPFTEGKTTTTYQNLVVGGLNQGTLWTQDNKLWTITTSGEYVGFSSIQLGDGGNILVTGGKTLFLTGTGTENEIVTGTGVTIFVNGNSNLAFGGSANSSKGGLLNGNINVIAGSMEVEYGDYTVNGVLTLGKAGTGSAAVGGQTSASQGNLEVSKNGSLTVQSLVGTGLNTVFLSSGTLNVKEGFSANVNSATPGNGIVLNKDSTLEVGQNLSIQSITPATNRGQIGLFASESDVSVGGNLTATDASIELAGSSLQVNGSYQQTDTTQNKMANDLALRLTNVGEVASTLEVKGDLTTTANNIVIVNSTVDVSGDLSINGQTIGTGTSAQRPTGLVLNGAQLKATNINLSNVRTGLIPGTTDNQDSNYLSGDIKATGTLAVDGVSDVALHDGTLEAVVVTIGQDATLTLGVPADVLETLTERRDGNLPDVMVVDASIGQVDNLQGTLEIGGVAPAGEGQTEVAIGNLTFDVAADEDNPANVVIDGASAIVLGNTSVEVLDTVTPLIAAKAPEGSEFTNYLVAGQTVRMGDYNGFAIGTAATAQNSGLSIEEGTAVAVDAKSLALSGGVQNKTVTLFSYAGEEAVADAPEVSIAPTAFFLVTNPVGNMKINVAQGFNTEGIEVTSEQVKTSNPLYTAEWYVENDAGTPSGASEGGAETPVESAIISVTIDPEQVSGTPESLNSLATNTILEAAEMGYGVNEGANTILDLLAPITSTAQYGDLRNAINSIALRGAAAHAHEIGISAASMVIDSVWDHSSKLAAAPHEQAKADLWITLDWNHSRANDYKAAGLDNGYKLDLYGATFGADYDFANGLAAGLAVSVGGGEAKSKGFNAGQKTDVTYWGINLYGTYTSPIVNVIGNVGYIGIKNKTKIGGDKGRPDANIWTIGVKAEKDFAINEQFTVTPHVGIRYLSVDVDDFNLKGFHYGTDKANLVQFPIGVAFAANLKTANGAAVKPFLDLSFVPTAGDKNVDNTFGIQGGTMSDTIDTTIASGAMFQGKIGVNASYGAHNFGLNFAIGGGNKGRLDTGLQAKYRFVF